MTTSTAEVPSDAPAIAPPRRRLLPRRWLGLCVWLALVAASAWLWHRSYVASDVLLYHLRDGSVQGAMSHRGRVVVASSTLSLGPERALTAERISAPVADLDWLFHGVYAQAPWVSQHWGVGASAGHKGDLPDPSATWSAVSFPHWLLLVPLAAGAALHLWRHTFRVAARRRRRRGLCVDCGYDLRESSGGACPECGATA